MRWALLLLCVGMLAAQVPGAMGRTTGAQQQTLDSNREQLSVTQEAGQRGFIFRNVCLA